ncbi:MAG: hypothetical protein ACYTDT_13910 [Planctomycetota bacterium]|jgi:transposase InsO family protein
MVDLQDIKMTLACSWAYVAGWLKLPYSTLHRWIQRQLAGKPRRKRPGPKPVGPLSLDQSLKDSLGHGRTRSRGSGKVHATLKGDSPRRCIQWAINEHHKEHNEILRGEMTRVEWSDPMVAWAMDDTDVTALVGVDPQTGGRRYINTIMDMQSRHKFDAVPAPMLTHTQMAERLAALFRRYGAPLVLKRDNGGNLNGSAVKGVLEKFGVIALNSPPYYSQYNGAVEHANLEIKVQMDADIITTLQMRSNHLNEVTLPILATNAIHELNHKKRRILGGQNSCFAFHSKARRQRFSKRERRTIFDEIGTIAFDLMAHTGTDKRGVAKAKRLAKEAWLTERRYIRAEKNREVLPNNQPNLTHN